MSSSGNNPMIDILYLMDCTGSMKSWIQACKEKVSQVGAKVKENFPNHILRQAFIGYRDYKDEGAVMKLDFVDENNLYKLQNFIQPIQAAGGGDTPEDIAPALNAASTLSWVSNTKLVLHFADAPCHGQDYHNESGDSYPNGSPTGFDPKTELGKLFQSNIDYYFVKVGGGEITKKMVEIFRNVQRNSGKMVNFKEIDAQDDPQKFLLLVKVSVAESINHQDST